MWMYLRKHKETVVSKIRTLRAIPGTLKKLNQLKSKEDPFYRNPSTTKALSDQIWRDGLREMLVES